MRTRDYVLVGASALSALALAACQTVERPEAEAGSPEVRDVVIRNPEAETELVANSIVKAESGGRIELRGGVHLRRPETDVDADNVTIFNPGGNWEADGKIRIRTPAESVVVVKSDRTSKGPDSIVLTGNVLVAFQLGDLKADEVTIRAVDGRPLDLHPANRGAIAGRDVELATSQGRVVDAHH